MKMEELCCLECRFFSPGDLYGSPAWEYENEINKTIEPNGVCRFNSPQVGDTLKDDDGETFNDFGQWPRVLWCDWCGRFEKRQNESASKSKNKVT